jgi:hypothetical protein
MRVILILVAVVIAWICYGALRRRREQRTYMAAFRSVYGESPQSPTLKMMSMYGWPLFTITYPTKEARQAAAEQGLDDAFKTAIGKVCGHIRHKDVVFDPDQAVNFTYEGEMLEQSQAWKADWDRVNTR